MDGIERVPDHLRCRRTDGKRWRCPRLALQHFSFCDLHQVQARRRQYKLPVPDSIKLRRGRRGRLSSSTSVPPPVDHGHIPKKRRVEIPVGEGEEEEEEEDRMRNVDGGYLVGFTRMMAWRRKMSNDEECNTEEVMEKTVPVEESGIRIQRRTIRTKQKEETFDIRESTVVKGHNKNVKRRETTGIKNKFETSKMKQTTALKTKDESLKSKGTSGIKPTGTISIRESRKIKSRDETLVRDTWLPALPSKEMTLDIQSNTGKWKEYFRVRKDAMVSPMPFEELETNQKNVSPMMQTITPEVSEECSVDVPDHLRCRRSDGKRWRCRRQAMENHCFCELHYIQQYRRQYKLGVPESLKLKRKSGGPIVAKPQVFDQIPKERTKGMIEQGEEPRKVNHRVKRRKKIESLLVELMQMVLKRQMERREKEEMRKHKESVEVMRKLPNGLMAISPASNVATNSRNNGHHLDRKLVLDPSSFLRWCFRSKNVELPSVGTVQKRHQKRICHRCQNNSMCQTIRCSSCQKGFFCKACIKKWYSGLSAEDMKVACPICRGKCHWAACLPAGLEESDTIFHSVRVT